MIMKANNPNESLKGRGSAHNPDNRFSDDSRYKDDEAWDDPEEPAPGTRFISSPARTAVSYNDSPDVGMSATVNPYRGCEHGCIYCYARPTHEYFGFSAGLDFETKILVKENAPELLRKELGSRRWKPQVVAMSGVTDCYQPAERKMRLTRRCLEVFTECRNPVVIITKNYLVTRDIDLLQELSRFDAVHVVLSVTTLDPALTRVMEPRASHPKKRLAAIEDLARAGVRVGVNVAPVIPGLTDHEIPAILQAAADAGAVTAGFVPVRLPYGVGPLFEDWLGRHFPDRKDKVLNRIRSMRDGRLNDPDFNTRMEGKGLFAEQMASLFDVAYRKAGFPKPSKPLTTEHFRKPRGPQLDLFEDFPGGLIGSGIGV
jgi:DNA repair photolyase